MFCAMPQRDVFVDWSRTRYITRRSSGFSPNVDVYYCGDPQRAIVKVDLAGVELSEVGIEVSGRHLAIVGERQLQESEGRVYRASATYEEGILRIELPLRDPNETTRRVPIGRK
jgi:HSP20 family protein